MDRVTLDCINIKNLFNRFNYQIDLRNGEDVSVLIAPNGCGKTTIFNIITFMFKPTYQGFRKVCEVPFDECECILSNGKSVILKSKPDKSSKNIFVNRIDDDDDFIYDDDFAVPFEENRTVRELTLVIGKDSIIYNQKIQNRLSEMDPDLLRLVEDVGPYEYKMNNIPPRYRSVLRELDLLFSQIEDLLKKNHSFISINYITADRLHLGNLTSSQKKTFFRRHYGDAVVISGPMKWAQNNTKSIINEAKVEVAVRQTKAKDELPKQYLEVKKPLWGYDEFKMKWKAYVDNIEKYCSIGLLDPVEPILNMDKLEKYYNEKGPFLTVYLAAFAKTLEPLEPDYNKLKLFAEIFNERNRITKKTITFGRDGIKLTVDGSPLALDCLSSGEKNDFIMFYELIFNSQKNGLVLIDEPEISLHIEWQKTFLDSLLDICKMNGLKAIVATHSPNIIHGHRELFAERGIEYDAAED